MPDNRILITGVTGVLGWNLCRYFANHGYQVEGTYRQNKPEWSGVLPRQLILEDGDSIRQLVRGSKYRSVIHAAAMTHPDECEQVPELTHAVNVKGTELLVEALPQGVPLIYISTDLVFDGVQGNYSERDEANPLNTYARSKLEAEQSVLRRAGSVVVRMAKIYSQGSPFHTCFVCWLRTRLQNQEKVPLFKDQYRTPIYVGDVARGLEEVVSHGACYNLYHLGGPQRLSRMEFGELYADVFGADRSRIIPIPFESVGLVARGRDCSFDSSRFIREFHFQPSGVPEGLQRMKEAIY